MIDLKTPLPEKRARQLKVGDIVGITGVIFTGRDVLHKYLYEGSELPFSLEGHILFHCGPIVIEQDGQWQVIAAGPTTSTRQEPYAWKVIEKTGVRGIMGKGGMGHKTVEACKAQGCVYLHTMGGTAQLLAQRIIRVNGVHFLKEFGSPEAMWEFEVKDFPAVVTIDAHGNSLHDAVQRTSHKKLESIYSITLNAR